MGNVTDLMASIRQSLGEIQTHHKDKNGVPFNSEKIREAQENFQLTNAEIYEMFHVFRKADLLGTGYINLDNIYYMINEEVGIISPYLERLFSLIKKQHVDKANFLEFLPVLCTFCLYTRQQLISFVFCMLDTDHNGFISKKDMLNFVSEKRFDAPVFPRNFMLSIDAIELERPDKISFEQFLNIEQDILFLIYPLARLQKGLQKVFGGRRLWESVYTRILQLEKNNEAQKMQHSSDNSKKKKGNATEKMNNFEKFIAEHSVVDRFISETCKLPPRQQFRRGSDSRINVRLGGERSPKRKRSTEYIKKEFEAVKMNEETQQGKKEKDKKFIKKTRDNLVTKIPGFFVRDKKESKELRLAKSITSIQNSSRKKVGTPRKSSIESDVKGRHSLQNLDEKYESTRKRSMIEKSQIMSGTHSRIDFQKKGTNEILLPMTRNQSKLLEEI